MNLTESTSIESTFHVDQAIKTRRSVRAFLPTPIPRALIEEVLEVARRAPSGTNIQPWKVYVMTGAFKDEFSRKILATHDEPGFTTRHQREYHYYPEVWKSPYIDRRRKIGWDMYGLLGIGRDDKAAMRRQARRNFVFFDAPVGMIFTMDRTMERGSLLDYGMFLENIMIAARARGLDTCPQAAFQEFHRVVAEHLAMPENETLVCAMSLGYADPNDVVNKLETEREAVPGFTVFLE